MRRYAKNENKQTFSMLSPEQKKAYIKNEIISWILHLAVSAAAVLTVGFLLFQPIRVEGASMMDTLHDHDFMFVTKYDYILGNPESGDVVVCRYPNSTSLYVKRLIGLPGDTIEIKHNIVYRNGKALDEAYLSSEHNDSPFFANMDKKVLGENEYFVMGDNRDNSHDSRSSDVDTLTRGQIRGHVRFVFFPFDNIRSIQ